MSDLTIHGHVVPVPLSQSYRLMNHGPTVLVSACHGGQDNVMAAAWACVLDFGDAPKVTVVLDKATCTRRLIEASGWFALQLPCVGQVSLTVGVGTDSALEVPDKLDRHGVRLFDRPPGHAPLVEGCVGWLLCRLLPEPHNQDTYDLFMGQVEAAWADDRVFRDGRWHFEDAPFEMRTLHHVAGGRFVVAGPTVGVPRERPKVYLAGPDVFYPNARAHGQALCELCAAHGFQGLFPLDAPVDPDVQPRSLAIFQANRKWIDESDAVVANLCDWRGPEPDSGTVWEVAYALANGKPVIGYLPSSASLRERMADVAPQGVDRDGNEVEDFGLPLNLMLAHSLTGMVFGPQEGHVGALAALACLRRHFSSLT